MTTEWGKWGFSQVYYYLTFTLWYYYNAILSFWIFFVFQRGFRAASESGVWSHLSGQSGSTSSLPSSILTTLSCPCKAGSVSGVQPLSPSLSGLTSSRPCSIFTTPSYPFWAASESGVSPHLFSLSRLTPSPLRNIYHSFMSIPSVMRERCSAGIIWPFRVNLSPPPSCPFRAVHASGPRPENPLHWYHSTPSLLD